MGLWRRFLSVGVWVQSAILGLVILISLPLSVQIWGEVSRKLEELRTSQNDNVIWNLTQLEVEFLKFERTLILGIQEGAPDAKQLQEVRRRFNIYFSRLETLNGGALYQRAFEEYGTMGILTGLRMEVAEILPYFDLPDDEFYTKLPEILAMQEGRERLVRRIIARGNQFTGVHGQAQRDDISRLLLRLSIASMVLFVALGLATILFFRQSMGHRARAIEHKQSSARFATVISTSPDALIVTDDAGNIVEFNRAAERLVGIERARALGKPFPRYLTDQDGQLADLPLANGSRIAGVQLTLQTASSALVPVELSQGVAEFETQRFYVYFLRDISDRLAADRALLASRDRALAGERAKSRFLAVMSHEMRTPLNGILGLVELLRSGDTPPEEQKRYLELLRNSGQILLDHVNDVLDIAQLEADGVRLNPQPFDMDQMLADIIGPMEVAAEARGNHIALDKSGPLGWFTGDGARLRQVLTNLIGNAVKFTDEGAVMVSAVSYAGRRGDTAMVEFQITDTGVGIAEQDVARIFDDFVRIDRGDSQQPEGTGLGLGIAKRIVEAMGGQIGVDSIEGDGSTFWVTLELPRATPVQAGLGAGAALTDQEEAENPLKILVVEDNATNRLVVRDLLERYGHSVSEEVNGKLGAERAAAEEFDVILMDLNMPVMGGLESCKRIRQAGASQNARIVALTAHVLERDDRIYAEAGMDGVLSKPLDRQDLLRVLRGERQIHTRQQHGQEVLDEGHLGQVMSSLGPDRSRDLMQGLGQEVDALMIRLKEVDMSSPCAASLMAEVHSMAGSAAMVGARKLRSSLNDLEGELERGGEIDLHRWRDHLIPIWQETQQALNALEARVH